MREDDGRGARPTNPLLLVEAALALVLFALFFFLFLLPVGRGSFAPRWWTWILLGSMFFGLLALDGWRRRGSPRRPGASLGRGPAPPPRGGDERVQP